MSITPDIANYRELASELRALPELKPIKSRQRRFILAFTKTFSVQAAAELSGIPWVNHYSWLKKSEQYKQAFEYAKEIAGDYAEGDVYQRAFIGDARIKSKIVEGQVVEEKYNHKSDVLAIFMLKGLKPQYRDNFSINQFAGPVQLNVKLDSQAVDPMALSGKQALINDGESK